MLLRLPTGGCAEGQRGGQRTLAESVLYCGEAKGSISGHQDCTEGVFTLRATLPASWVKSSVIRQNQKSSWPDDSVYKGTYCSPSDLSLNPSTYMEEGKNGLLPRCPLKHPKHARMHRESHTRQHAEESESGCPAPEPKAQGTSQKGRGGHKDCKSQRTRKCALRLLP